MTRVTSKHNVPLGIPGGPEFRPGATVLVERWDVLKQNALVAAWLSAGLIVEESDPLDHDGDGKKGGSLPKGQRVSKKIDGED